MLRSSIAALALVVAGTAVACKRSEPQPPPPVSDVELRTDRQRVLTGTVGTGKFESQATYVLVDANNTGPRDLLVTLRGNLVDDRGRPAGRLLAQSLRVPAGGMRMFALVDDQSAARPSAIGAEIEIAGALVPEYEPPVIVTDGRVDIDSDRAVAQGYVVNTAQRAVKVIVIAGFYDGEGNPLKRPSTQLEIDGGEKRGVQLVGPPGSKSAYLFVGEYGY